MKNKEAPAEIFDLLCTVDFQLPDHTRQLQLPAVHIFKMSYITS